MLLEAVTQYPKAPNQQNKNPIEEKSTWENANTTAKPIIQVWLQPDGSNHQKTRRFTFFENEIHFFLLKILLYLNRILLGVGH